MQFKEVIGQQKIKSALVHQIAADRLSHAQLFTGPEGSGKLQLALAFAQYLMCENRQENDSCGECASCKLSMQMNHPDIHFVFPIVLSTSHRISDDRIEEWKDLVLRQKYFGLNQWLIHLDDLGKNPVIAKDEAQKIQSKLSLTSYSGRYKIMVVWLAETMNTVAANKLLKLLEEPPENTIFLMTANNPDSILATIISRTQLVKVPALSNLEVEGYLKEERGIDDSAAHAIAALADGNLGEAIHISEGDQSQMHYFDLFVKVMRAAYAANPMDLMEVSDELGALQKEQQKNFVKYGLRIFRESILQNYMKGQLSNLRAQEQQFLDKFARFINNQNITELHDEFNTAHYHLERNANARILFSDLVIKLTKLIKKGV